MEKNAKQNWQMRALKKVDSLLLVVVVMVFVMCVCVYIFVMMAQSMRRPLTLQTTFKSEWIETEIEFKQKNQEELNAIRNNNNIATKQTPFSLSLSFSLPLFWHWYILEKSVVSPRVYDRLMSYI